MLSELQPGSASAFCTSDVRSDGKHCLLARVRLYSPQHAGSVAICSIFPTVLSRESRQAKRLNIPNKTGPERFLPATCQQQHA